MLNIPNFLTIFRIFASVVFLVLSLQGRWNLALPVFCIAALTDMMDGALARLLHQRTRLGSLLDPIADKLLMFFSFVTLTEWGFMPLPITVLVIARDLMIFGGFLALKSKKVYIVYRPTYLSKATTFFQITIILWALLKTQYGARFAAGPYVTIEAFLLGFTTLLTVSTGVQYFRIGWDMLHDAPQTYCK